MIFICGLQILGIYCSDLPWLFLPHIHEPGKAMQYPRASFATKTNRRQEIKHREDSITNFVITNMTANSSFYNWSVAEVIKCEEMFAWWKVCVLVLLVLPFLGWLIYVASFSFFFIPFLFLYFSFFFSWLHVVSLSHLNLPCTTQNVVLVMLIKENVM